MKILENHTGQVRLERIIRRELLPKLELLAAGISLQFIDSLIIMSELRIVNKGQYLEEAGSRSDGNLLYLNTGIAHTFYRDNINDKPIITKIWKKHDIIFDLDNFLNCERRQESTQMLEDGELLSISYRNLKKLMKTYPNMVSFLLHLQAEKERQFIYYQHLLKLNVEEKVRIYLNDNPAMINRINNEYIAMHLGISRSRFSKAYSVYKRGNSLS